MAVIYVSGWTSQFCVKDSAIMVSRSARAVPWFGAAARALIVLIGLALLATHAMAAQPSPLPKLGVISGGDKSANHRWESNASTKFFTDALRKRLPQESNSVVDVELLAIERNTNDPLALSGNTATASIRYRVLDSRNGTMLFDQVIDSKYDTGTGNLFALSVLESSGFKGVLNQNLERFLALYAADSRVTTVARSGATGAGNGPLVKEGDHLAAVGSPGTGFAGLGLRPATEDELKRLAKGYDYGETVTAAWIEGPADKAGIRPDDIIVMIGNSRITAGDGTAAQLSRLAAGSTVPIAIIRNGSSMTLTVRLGQRPSKSEAAESRITFRKLPVSEIVSLEKEAVTNPAESLTCYTLSTTPGEKYQIRASQDAKDSVFLGLIISPGNRCTGADKPSYLGSEIAPQSTRTEGSSYATYRTFVAGGGPYAVMVYAPPSAGFKRSFSISHKLLGRQAAGWAPTLQSLLFSQESKFQTASTISVPSGSSRSPGQNFRDCAAICPEMVVLPAGSFLMGSSSAEVDREGNEGPVHRVVFARAFAMGKYEVSYDEWAACVADGACAKPKATGWGEDRRPVVNISWIDARVYADWLSQKTGQHYFIPSESEWEYAARAGTMTPWNTGEAILTDDANILGQFKQVVPVGGFPPNAFGLHDTHGNAREWVLDCADVGYFGVPDDGGAASRANCDARIVRGGGFNSEPANARSAARFVIKPTTTAADTGLRIARSM
ncbi:SUMF1/EgtB/PvdO family nonheme iron enzyme [Sphingomonadaceae bacterium G21617-S1]|nr:SUMF1/EgtB/PvdO family nonheme iron enzyme [Sphingomonadaceae bacterium G21617-S1]